MARVFSFERHVLSHYCRAIMRFVLGICLICPLFFVLKSRNSLRGKALFYVHHKKQDIIRTVALAIFSLNINPYTTHTVPALLIFVRFKRGIIC